MSKDAGKKTYHQVIRKIAQQNERNRPKSVRESYQENRILNEEENETKNPFLGATQPISQSRNNSGLIKHFNENTVPKLTISFNARRVSVETTRGRKSSQKKFLKNIENEIAIYTIKKSKQNSNSSLCFSNEIRCASNDRGIQAYIKKPLNKSLTKSQRNRSPEQLSVHSKTSLNDSKKFDVKNLLRLFSPSPKNKEAEMRLESLFT